MFRIFSQELGTSLKTVVFGAANHSFPPGWQGQSFQFNEVPTLRDASEIVNFIGVENFPGHILFTYLHELT